MAAAVDGLMVCRTGRGQRAGLAGVLAVLGALAVAPNVSALPAPVLNTGGCVTSVSGGSQTCSQHGMADIFSQADLTTLTATARIDNKGPYSFLTSASVTYYLELASSSGSFGTGTVPLLLTMNGFTDVGGIPVTVGTGFNHNKATADVRFDSHSVGSACAGYGCYGGSVSSFGGTLQIDVRPFGSAYQIGSNIFQIVVDARAETNSNYPTSYAYATADPYIEIEPGFLAAHPEYSLSFSAGVTNSPPVPEPSIALLLGSGLLGLTAFGRRPQR
jgi:hypothetical protein